VQSTIAKEGRGGTFGTEIEANTATSRDPKFCQTKNKRKNIKGFQSTVGLEKKKRKTNGQRRQRSPLLSKTDPPPGLKGHDEAGKKTRWGQLQQGKFESGHPSFGGQKRAGKPKKKDWEKTDT